MSQAEIYMDVEAVRGLSTRFAGMSERLEAISKSLQAAILAIKASAFVGLTGNAAYAAYLEQIQPVIDRFSKTCSEMSGDLEASVKAYEEGDMQGANLFAYKS